MSEQDYKVGDRVRVTKVYEGTVKAKVREHPSYVELNEGDVFIGPNGKFAVTVEVLETKYEEGEMYVDADGDFFCYQPGSEGDPEGDPRPWFAPGDNKSFRITFPTPPLRKLVPEAE